MLLKSSIIATCGLAVSAFAQSAQVTIEASHGGAGNGLTNKTISVPLNTTYTDPALQTVSYLFLTGATGVAVESITCTPYLYPNGTGKGGLPFTSNSPSYLSTNTVQVGSIICLSSAAGSSNSTGAAPISTSSLPNTTSLSTATSLSTVASSSSTPSSSLTTQPAPSSYVGAPATAATSTLLTTTIMSAGASGTSPITSTITSVVGVAAASSPPTSTTPSAAGDAAVSASSTSSAAAGLSTHNAAESLLVTEGAWFGLAIAALGLAVMGRTDVGGVACVGTD
ncbi:hypothetical protein LTS09_014003 [Friedmanniomyces endolithicus]|nr:hypothetical protein LTS09_014003 [Friedmanniomyces endolithicus]